MPSDTEVDASDDEALPFDEPPNYPDPDTFWEAPLFPEPNYHLARVAKIVCAQVRGNPNDRSLNINHTVGWDILVGSISNALLELEGKATVRVDSEPFYRKRPAVAIRNSIQPDGLICLEDGVKMVLLTRYLMRKYGLTPAAYRQRWSLPHDYPMIAPNAAAKRSEVAKRSGLGMKRKDTNREPS